MADRTEIATPPLTPEQLDRAYETGKVETFGVVHKDGKAEIVRVTVSLEQYQDMQKRK